MKLAFLIDPPNRLVPEKDSSIAMMRSAASAGHEIWCFTRDSLCWLDGVVSANMHRLGIRPDCDAWFDVLERAQRRLVEMDAVLARQDPPFDFEYLAATWLLSRATADGALVLNDPAAIRDHSEKVSILEFTEWIPPTLVSRDQAQIQEFIDAQRDVVLKPLNLMGGRSVFRVRAGDWNRTAIVEEMLQGGCRTIMAQRHIREIKEGDKRVLLIGGEVVPYSLARVPRAGESRGNLAAGGTAVAQPLAERDRRLAESLAGRLWPRGLFLVGLDIIGPWLTEINVTSPTCFNELEKQTGWNVADFFVRKLEGVVKHNHVSAHQGRDCAYRLAS